MRNMGGPTRMWGVSLVWDLGEVQARSALCPAHSQCFEEYWWRACGNIEKEEKLSDDGNWELLELITLLRDHLKYCNCFLTYGSKALNYAW